MRPPKKGLTLKGVHYEIDWDSVRIGDSFFIPCLDTPKVIDVIRLKIKRLRWEMIYEVRIEAGKWGVRFWRTL